MHEQRSWKWATIALGVLALIMTWKVTAAPADAGAIVQASRATNIATINVGDVIDRLLERESREQELAGFVEKRQASLNEMEAELEAMTSEIDVTPADSDRRRELFEQAVRQRMLIEFEGNFGTRIIAEQQKDMRLELFNKVREATKAYAQSEGWDMVIISDHGAEIPGDLSPQDTLGAIVTRRVLYANDGIDITDEVVRRMNNEFNRE